MQITGDSDPRVLVIPGGMVYTQHLERESGYNERRTNVDCTLVILAAGMGSRYGGVKQLDAVGPQGEIIMDYSVHDAVRAGFRRVVFILRREIFEDFMDTVGRRLEGRLAALGVTWAYAFQEPGEMPPGRTRPWGTGQAVMCCEGLLDGPFLIINADDYYGQDAYARAYAFLSRCRPGERGKFGMVGFVLENTLSDEGGVTRGVCTVNEDGYLDSIHETRNIEKTADGAAARFGDELVPLDPKCLVSMNMWMLTPDFTEGLAAGFETFKAHMTDPLKDEYLLPDIVNRQLEAGHVSVKVLSTVDQWFGVTFPGDKPVAAEAIRRMHARGLYREDLFSDL